MYVHVVMCACARVCTDASISYQLQKQEESVAKEAI